MTRKKARRRRRTDWRDEHKQTMNHGSLMFPPPEFVDRKGEIDMSAVQLCWRDTREEVMTEYRKPGKRPAFWWHFDSPEPRNRDIPEAAQLEAMGELSAGELKQLAEMARVEDEKLHGNPHNSGGLPFRRDWAFWRFLAERNPAMTEAEQLIAEDRLHHIEQAIVADPQSFMAGRICLTRSRIGYLEDSEMDLLKLWPPEPPRARKLVKTSDFTNPRRRSVR